MNLHARLLLHQFCMTLFSERGESNKTDANKVLYKASYEAPLIRKIRLHSNLIPASLLASLCWGSEFQVSFIIKFDFIRVFRK